MQYYCTQITNHSTVQQHQKNVNTEKNCIQLLASVINGVTFSMVMHTKVEFCMVASNEVWVDRIRPSLHGKEQ